MEQAMMRMAVPLALACLAVAGAARAGDQAAARPGLSGDQAMLLHCSAAFALIAGEQKRGVKSAQDYPPLESRGKEFFVRVSAQLMDELHATREQLEELLREQVAQLEQGSAAAGDPAAYVDEVMQPCLAELEVSGV
jgi:hypothetical protein